MSIGKRLEINKSDRYGRLEILEEIPGSSRKIRRRFLCHCSCGNKKIVFLSELIRGNTTSCGCFQKENARKQQLTHGKAGTRIYNVWRSMKKRCLIKDHKSFKHYGGRGIQVCKRWMRFENFYKDMGEGPRGRSLDRIDNDGNYNKDNCRWSTVFEQAKNRRNTVLITYNGETLCQSDWSKKIGLGDDTISKRIKSGWTKTDAVSLPLFSRNPLLIDKK